MIFIERLILNRNKAGKTQKQLGSECGLSERTIQSYELGERKPNYDALISLADYFEVSIDYLVGRTDNPEVNK